MMVLALNKKVLPRVFLVSDDSDIQSLVTRDDNFSDYSLSVAQLDVDIVAQYHKIEPQLAIIDFCITDYDCLDLINILKNQGNIPIILLIDPGNFSHLEQATQATVDSVFTKPVQPQQLLVSIQFHLLRYRQNQHKYCMPRRCSVVTQHLFSDFPMSINNPCSHSMDKQDFLNKLSGLLEYINDEEITNACMKIQILEKEISENQSWGKESAHLKNIFYNHIQQQIRFGDLIAIDSGYQYFLLFPDLDRFTATTVIKRIVQSLSRLLENINKKSNLMVCAGAVIFDKKSNTDQIIADIETALIEAKNRKYDNHIVKNLLGYGLENNIKKVSYASIIQNALRNDEFFLHYQPIMALSDLSIKHYEALIRLLDSEGSFEQPLKIISTAENNRLIKDIDIRVLDLAMQKLASIDPVNREISISVNLSGTHFGDKSLLSDICALIDYHGINPSRLIFEMTETAAIKDLNSASRFIASLKDLGCQFGLDDFGTGYASFSYLRALPVDYLKIDGIFVKEIINNRADQLFVKAIVDVAQGMGVKTIAECVENEETLGMLTLLGIDFAQGYYIGYPDHLPQLPDRLSITAGGGVKK